MRCLVVLWLGLGIPAALGAGLPIRPVPPAVLETIVAQAPAPPAAVADLGLTLRLIDFIDCTRTDEPHDFRDQGTSRVVTGPAGTYRASAPHRHAFFSYAYRTAGGDRPVLLVIEYPDDARRRMAFMTHDAARPAQAHVSFTPEGGVYTGYPLPLTNALAIYTLIAWPQDDWSPLLAVNYGRRAESQAVAARIWVYAIEAFPQPMTTADPNGRRLGLFAPLGFLLTRDNFGWRSPRAVDHVVDYCRVAGVNRICAEVYANQGWGGMVTVPAWDVPDDHGYLEGVLRTLDRRGGVDFIAGIVADGMYGDVKSGGQLLRDLPQGRLRETLLRGVDEILDRYGPYRSFAGLALGSLETPGFYETLVRHGLAGDLVAHVHARRPDLEVQTFLGRPYLQTPFFMPRTDRARGRDYPTPTEADLVRGWESEGGDWYAHLAAQVRRNWRAWRLDPAEMARIPGLAVYEQIQPDDHRIVSAYRNQPRSALYHDLTQGRAEAPLIDTAYGAIFGFFDEGWLGLSAGYNFWYGKYWTAPEFNGPGDRGLAPWATLLAGHDRRAILAGGWTIKTFGLEGPLRRWARAYHRLPPVSLEALDTGPLDVVTCRWGRHAGRRYTALINRVAFPVAVHLDGRPLTLTPYGLETRVDAGAGAPRVSGTAPAVYRDFVAERLARFAGLCDRVAALDATAVPSAYRDLHARARALLDQGRCRAADRALAYGLEQELSLRQRVLQPPALPVARIVAPRNPADPATWPAIARLAVPQDGTGLESHTYFPNSWFGPADLSLDLYLGHDGTTLFFCLDVRDSKVRPADGCSLWLSTARYRDWRLPTEEAGPEITWSFRIPQKPSGTLEATTGVAHYRIQRTARGYRLGGRAPLAQLGMTSEQALGLLVNVVDEDGEPSVDRRKSWAKKQVLHVPYDPTWALWQDVRNAGELHWQ